MTTEEIKMSNGSVIKLKHGKIHCDNGPATYNSRTGSVAFYLNGMHCSFDHWLRAAGHKRLKPKEITLMLLKYGIKNNYE